MAPQKMVKINGRPRPSATLAGAALALALVLSLPASYLPPVWADEPLKGNVEETGVAPPDNTFSPAVPMAVPVMRKKKLKGTADDNALKGQADDDDPNLKGMKGQTDDSGPLRGSAQQDNDPAPLKTTLTQDQLQSEDPDRDDQMMAVEWDKWRNRLLRSVQMGVTEIVNSHENLVPHFDAQRGAVVYAPNIPLGTRATFWVKVNSARRVLDARILQSSGNPGYDKALLDAIYSLDGSNILRYPQGSKRTVVDQAATILTSDRQGQENFKFGDVERYRTP